MATPILRRFCTDTTLDVTYTSLEAIERQARELREHFEAQGWSKLEVEMSAQPYEEREYPTIFGMRMETMEEAEKREAGEARMAEMRREADRRDYERLRKQFEADRRDYERLRKQFEGK